MSSSEGESIFLTQSKYRDPEESVSTDGILSDILNLEKENVKPQPRFDVKLDLFSDVSEDELVEASQGVENIERFLRPLNQAELDDLVKRGLSKKTEQKTKWAINLFKKWQEDRKHKATGKETFISNKNILEMSDEELNKTMGYFVAEVRNQKGEDYMPNTIYELVCSVQHYMRQTGRFVSFFDDETFNGFKNVLDSKMKELSGRGLGIDKKKAEVISEEQEEVMWRKNILGTDTPQKLLDTMLFVLGLNFALRAGQEHRNLRVGKYSQISIIKESSGLRYLEYKEDVSKTNRGGLQHRNLKPKVTRAYENHRVPERCPVLIYEKYLSLRPKDGKCDALYLRPLKYAQSETWYADSPVGVHVLTKTIGNLCERAGFKGHFTNHSLRATAATRLYEAGIDEQLITEKTGHKSTAVRSYKRTTNEQQQNVSDIIHGNIVNSDDGKCTKKMKMCDFTSSASNVINISSGNMSFSFQF